MQTGPKISFVGQAQEHLKLHVLNSRQATFPTAEPLQDTDGNKDAALPGMCSSNTEPE
jgi:hypothetical protein